MKRLLIRQLEARQQPDLLEHWSADLTNIASCNFSYGDAGDGVPSSISNVAQVLYEETAKLTTQFASHPKD